MQRTAKKCTQFYNARAELLFCSLDHLFFHVLVAVAVVVGRLLGALIIYDPKKLIFGWIIMKKLYGSFYSEKITNSTSASKLGVFKALRLNL